MKSIAILILATPLTFAQATPQQQTPPAANQQPAPPAQPAPPRNPKAQPMAKSEAEHKDYQAILAQADLDAAQKAADEFAQKYPDSELRVPAYSVLMQKFTATNNADRTLENASKVLAIDPENTLALVISAATYAERTRSTDLDRDERYARGMANAQKAIQSIDTGFVVPPNTPAEAFAAAKRTIIAMAHSAMGYIDMNKKNYAGAEQHLLEAAQTNPQVTDPVVFYRLSLAQHAQKKFKEALDSVNKAIPAAQAAKDAQTLRLAEEERAKLLKAQAPPSPQ